MNIVLFGLGPHAQRIYLKYITEKNIFNKILIVDLVEREEELRKVLDGLGINYELVLFDNAIRNSEKLTREQRQILSSLIDKYSIKKAIVSTEPRSHLLYLNYCLDKGLDIMCDKPITTPLYTNSEYGANKIEEDYLQLLSRFRNSGTTLFEIQTQRRSHKGYKFVYDYITNIVQKFGVPITKIKISHCDGNWNMPNEVIYQENHPYKYGYGKLMHSGYHFLDLLTYFMDINTTNGFGYSEREIAVSDYRPSDFFVYYGKEFNEKLGFKEDESIYENIDLLKNFGELDISALVTFKDENASVLTTAILDLAQSGFSRRSWFELPKDTYKGNGRVRHESVEITVGPLLNVKVFSFQSTEINKNPRVGHDAGELEHFEIQIYSNSDITGEPAFQKYLLSDLCNSESVGISYIGQNEHARMIALDDFFINMKSNSSIESHKNTISLLKDMELQMSRRYSSSEFRFSVEAIIEYKGKYLICKRSKNARVAPGIWNVPAGKVRNFEGFEEAVIREIYEETNLLATNPQYLAYHFINKEYQRIVYTYLVTIDSDEQLIIDTNEFDDYAWISKNELDLYDSLSSHIKDEILKRDLGENVK